MSTEMHVIMKMLSDPEKLNFIAIPIELSPISSAQGQSKTLDDSARRHIEAIINIYDNDDCIDGDGDDDDCIDDDDDDIVNDKEEEDVDILDEDDDGDGIKHVLYDKYTDIISNWVQMAGDGPYCKGERIKTRLINYLRDTLNDKEFEMDGFHAWYDDMLRLAIAIKHASESQAGTWRIGFLCIYKIITLRARSPKNSSKIKEIASDEGDTPPKVQGLCVTRLSEYEWRSYHSYILNMKYIIKWSVEDPMNYKIATSMPVIFSIMLHYDLFGDIKKRHLIIQNIKFFPWKKLKSFLTLKDIIKNKKKTLKKNKKKFNNKLDGNTWPKLAEFEQGLKNFILFETPLNNIRFIKENEVNLSDFGDINECVDNLRNEIIEQLNSTNKNTLYCCREPYDENQNYIKCETNHPLCWRWIHQKCSGLTSKQFKSLSLKSKHYYCLQCRSLGFKKKLNDKEIEKIKQDLASSAANTSIQTTISSKASESAAFAPNQSISNQPKAQKTNNKNLITSFLPIKHLKPTQNDSNNNNIEKNPKYTETERKQTWIHCIDGGISLIEALEHQFFSKEDGKFSNLYFKDYLPFYVVDIFDMNEWIKLKTKNKDNNDKKKLIKIIKDTFIKKNESKIKKLHKFIKKCKIKSLSELTSIDYKVFKNELILFIYYTLLTSTKYPTLRDEELMHKSLFNNISHSDCKNIKILVDVAWHHCPNENFAETVAKMVGWIYSPERRKMKFDKLRLKKE